MELSLLELNKFMHGNFRFEQESPRWLLVKGKHKEMNKIFQRMVKENGRKLSNAAEVASTIQEVNPFHSASCGGSVGHLLSCGFANTQSKCRAVVRDFLFCFAIAMSVLGNRVNFSRDTCAGHERRELDAARPGEDAGAAARERQPLLGLVSEFERRFACVS